MNGARPIVFVTDFGLESEWVGICHAVMCKVAPASRVIDLSHFIEPLDVEAGARLLTDSLAYLPDDALRAKFAATGALDAKRVVTYCGGGIAASSDALALALLGRADVAVYDASLSEWATDPSLPMEQG